MNVAISHRSTFEQIAWLSFPGPEHRGLMLMLAAYFDDSGTHNDARILTWGGFIGTDRQWAALDVDWRAMLDQPLPGKRRLRKFSLADCQNHVNEFATYTLPESDLLQHEFREIIVKHGLIGVAYAVDRPTWERLATAPAKERFGDAETICFSSCFSGAIDRALKYFASERQLSLHFDQGRLSQKLSAIVQHVRDRYYGLPELVNIGFDMVEKVTPLQAADIIATESYWNALGVVTGNASQRPHFAHFLKRVSTEGFILDEAQIIQTLKDGGFA
jgi:hypothetical protein